MLEQLSTSRSQIFACRWAFSLLFWVWLVSLVSFISAVAIADWSIDDFSLTSIENPSEEEGSKLASGFDDGFGSELNAGASADCPSDSSEFIGNFRARNLECLPSETSNNGNGKNPNHNNEQETPSKNGNNGNGNGNGNGQSLKDYPDSFIWKPPPLFPSPLRAKPSKLCPLSKSGLVQFVICHEGLDIEIHESGAWIENAIWCMLFSFSFFLF